MRRTGQPLFSKKLCADALTRGMAFWAEGTPIWRFPAISTNMMFARQDRICSSNCILEVFGFFEVVRLFSGVINAFALAVSGVNPLSESVCAAIQREEFNAAA
jgi:hypothetical protein